MKDEELVRKIQIDLDEESLELLIKRYRGLIFSIINQYHLLANDYMIDKEDLHQEGNIGLYQAARTYKFDNDASFITYAYTVIRRRIIKRIKKASKIYMSEGVSMDNVLFNDANINLASDRLYDDPKRALMFKEMINKAYETFIKMSDDEKAIIRLRRESKTYQEIADVLNMNVKRVDYLLQKIRKKIKEYDLSNENIVLHKERSY